MPRDIVAWTDLAHINTWVNENVKPMTDMDHWGVVEKVLFGRRLSGTVKIAPC